jgi:hypothetical protein
MTDRPGDTRRGGVRTGTFGVSFSSRNDRAFCAGNCIVKARSSASPATFAGWRSSSAGPHRRGDGQMPARLRRWMRAGLRACVCRSAMVREVNVS